MGETVGGIVGENNGTINSCVNVGNISGFMNIGGICGKNEGTVIGSCNFGHITAGDRGGGICGDGSVEYCYNAGAVTGMRSGLFAICSDSANDCYYCNDLCKVSGVGVGLYITYMTGDNTLEYMVDYDNYFTTCDNIFDSTGNNIVAYSFPLPSYFDGKVAPISMHNFGTDNEDNADWQIVDAAIGSWEDLCAFSERVNAGETSLNAVLTTNINMTGVTDFASIGTSDKPYIGKFDGCGHIITGLKISKTRVDPTNLLDTTANNQGLFGYIGEGGLVENVGMMDGSISGYSYVGGIAGYNKGTVQSCFNTMEIKGGDGSYIGGIVGYNEGTVQNCYNTGAINGFTYVGGIAGRNYGPVSYCYSTGKINNAGASGITVGQNDGAISNCYYNSDNIGGKQGVFDTDDSAGVITGLTANSMTGAQMTSLFDEDNSGVWVSKSDGTADANNNKTAYYPQLKVFADRDVKYPDVLLHNFNMEGSFDWAAVTVIADFNDLAAFSEAVNGGNATLNAVLIDNIDLSGKSFESIGFYTHEWVKGYFSGKFDGCGNTISGLSTSLFGFTSEATVQNLILEGDITNSISSENRYAGAVVQNQKYGIIQNCYNKVNISLEDYDEVGGIVGYNLGGDIKGCMNVGTISGDSNVGGICGYSNAGPITLCCNIAEVTGTDNVGGICGVAADAEFVSNFSVSKVPLSGSGNAEYSYYCTDFYNGSSTGTGLSVENMTGTAAGAMQVFGGKTYSEDGSFKTYANATDTQGNVYANAFPQPKYFDGRVDPVLIHNFGTADDSDWQTEFVTISKADELITFANRVNNGEYTLNAILTDNIDMDGKAFTPIGTQTNKFSGKFDGCGNTIDKLVLSDVNANYQGLFGYVNENGLVENVTLTGGSITGNSTVSGIVSSNKGMVRNCHNANTIIGNDSYTGGVVGFNEGAGTVTVYSNTGAVSGTSTVGGVVSSNSGTMTNCFNTGSVTGTSEKVGGVAGYNSGSALISFCYNTGSVNGTGRVGGLVGKNNASITYCFSAGNVIGTGDYCGAVLGETDSSNITACYYDKNVCSLGAVNDSDYVEVTALSTMQMTGTDDTNRAQTNMAVLGFDATWVSKTDGAADANGNKTLYYPQLTVFGDTNVGVNVHNFGIDNTDNADWDVFLPISTHDELIKFSTRVNAGETKLNGVLTAAIDMDGKTFAPIGISTDTINGYSGKFDGRGNTISNLTIDGGINSYQGLFGSVVGGLIENVTLTGGSVKGSSKVGGIVGEFSGVMRNCRNENTVTGGTNVGGICGSTSEYYSVADGAVVNSVITGCINTGAVSGIDSVLNVSSIQSPSYVGGLFGNLTQTDLSKSYNRGEVIATSDETPSGVGGLAGMVYDSCGIENCYNIANVKCVDKQSGAAKGRSVGGIAGYIDSNASVRYCYNIGEVIGAEQVGSIVGTVGDSEDVSTVNNYYYNSDVCSVKAINGANYLSASVNVSDLKSANFKAANLVGFDTASVWTIPTDEPSIDDKGDGNRVVTYYFPYLKNVGSQVNSYGVTEHNFNAQDPTEISNPDDWREFVKISTPAQLNAFAARVNKGETLLNAILANDIDMSGVSFTPIGNNIKTYIGKFDGCGYVIKNLTISGGTNSKQGLFGKTQSALIMNVGLENCNISGKSVTGSICGEAASTRILRCYATGKVTGTGVDIGGICGYMGSSTRIADCFTDCEVSGGVVGGICGWADDSLLFFCVSVGTVTENKDIEAKHLGKVGGLLGHNSSGGLYYCYYDSSVCTGLTAVGREGMSASAVPDTQYYKGLYTDKMIASGLYEGLTMQPYNAPRAIPWTFTESTKAENIFSTTKNTATVYYPMLTVFANRNATRETADKITPASAKITFLAEYNDEDTVVTYGDVYDTSFELYYTIDDDTTQYPISGNVCLLSEDGAVLQATTEAYDEATQKFNKIKYDTTDKKIGVGETRISLKCTVVGLSEESTAEYTLTINKKQLTYTADSFKYYDGEARVNLSNITVGDFNDCKASFSITLPDSDVGTYTTFTDYSVTLSGTGKDFYTMDESNFTLNYEIKPRDINETTAEPIEIQPYEGTAVEPFVTLTYGNMTLVEDVDYTLAFSDNIEVGDNTAKITINGIGNYNGTRTINFTIKLLTKTTLSGVTIDSKTYDGTAVSHNGEPSAEYNGTPVAFDHYTFVWLNANGKKLNEAPKNAGDYKLLVTTVNDSYYVKEAFAFTITKAPLTATAPSKEITKGSALPELLNNEIIFSGFVNGENSSVLTIPSDTLSYESGTNRSVVGTYDILISGITAKNYEITFVNGTLTVKKGSGNGGGGTGGGDVLFKDATSESGSIGWENIITELKKLTQGGTLVIYMNDETTTTKDFMTALSGKNITVKFVIDDSKSITISGKNVPSAAAVYTNVKLYTKTSTIPSGVISTRFKDLTGVQLTIGDFPFEQQINVNLATENNGKFAALYRYDSTTGKLEYSAITKIAAGKAEFTVPYAGSYVAIIDDAEMIPGDVNGDGAINIKDALVIMRHVVGKELLGTKALINVDFNGTGVTMMNALAVMKYSLGIIDKIG